MAQATPQLNARTFVKSVHAGVRFRWKRAPPDVRSRLKARTATPIELFEPAR